MKLRRLIKNNHASIYPVIIFIIVLAVTSIIILIFNEFYTPFSQIMHSSDDSIDPAFDAPRSAGTAFIDLIYPKGILLGIFIIAGFGMVMQYQKKSYMDA